MKNFNQQIFLVLGIASMQSGRGRRGGAAGAGMQKEGLLAAAPSMAFVYICQINFLARGNIASHKMDCFKVPLS